MSGDPMQPSDDACRSCQIPDAACGSRGSTEHVGVNAGTQRFIDMGFSADLANAMTNASVVCNPTDRCVEEAVSSIDIAAQEFVTGFSGARLEGSIRVASSFLMLLKVVATEHGHPLIDNALQSWCNQCFAEIPELDVSGWSSYHQAILSNMLGTQRWGAATNPIKVTAVSDEVAGSYGFIVTQTRTAGDGTKTEDKLHLNLNLAGNESASLLGMVSARALDHLVLLGSLRVAHELGAVSSAVPEGVQFEGDPKDWSKVNSALKAIGGGLVRVGDV